MATTPPPRVIGTPPTPRHGPRFDAFEPHSTRQSARLANRQASRGSPSFSTPSTQCSPNDTDFSTDGISKKISPIEQDAFSLPQSPLASPTRRSNRKGNGTQQVTQANSLFDNTRGQTHPTSQSASLSLPNIYGQHTTLTANMLPTPAKTPRKKAVPDPSVVARTLFKNDTKHNNHEMPTPKRQKGKKFKGFSLESFEAEAEMEANDKITIFTDSRDRIPEVHETTDNPFLCRPNDGPTSARGVRQATRDKKMEEVLHRDDGMLYVFRGKKTFRKFDSDTEEDDDETDQGLLACRPDLLAEGGLPRVRPLTRSSIKPRLLFPTAPQRGTTPSLKSDHSQKAAGPVEKCEADEHDESRSNSDLPHASSKGVPITPPSKTTVSTPSTSLTSGRSLRSHIKEGQVALGSDTPSQTSNGTVTRVSPFARWTRTKSQVRKRVATKSSDSGEPAIKKSRTQ
ncbi:hypothetical protein ACO22_02253 [Paracoccidioides brasiliensis]|uniref:Uncharacterized protein n=1 Tax=Paracoccidioides brasiliensis TaxID=121759 RepID=A0A1D2JJA5_PARBR|nr:hypothetical protein ACO22_02253 [Paracoccidioides brasiliensis]